MQKKAESAEEKKAIELNVRKSQKQMFELADFQVQLKIGQGAFASVKRAVHKRTGH